MPSFRDDHILVISPGSQVTLAQLGLPESFTPAKLRLASRMFPALESGTWTWTKVREAREGEKDRLLATAMAGHDDDDDDDDDDEEDDEEDDDEEEVEEGDEATAAGTRPEGGSTDGPKASESTIKEVVNAAAEDTAKLEISEKKETKTEEEGVAIVKDEAKPSGSELKVEDSEMMDVVGEQEDEAEEEEEEEEEDADDDDDDDDDEDMGDVYVEDEDDEEGAVWCMKEGKVVDWGCFFALLQHVHETINPTFHTPILMLCPPAFTPSDKEMITQFVFEKLKAPGFVLMDMALATLWAYGLSTSTVIDVGLEKTDVTPILDFAIQERARETIPGWGGESMTKHLMKLLPELKYEEVEQLKRSPICEILHSGNLLPNATSVNTAIAAGSDKMKRAAEMDGSDLIDEEEGTMNVAAIVASGKTHEFLAKREKEKRGEAERKLPNRERETNSFWVVEKKKPGDEPTLSSAMILDEPQSAVSVSAPKLPEVVVGAEAPPAIPVATVAAETPSASTVPAPEVVSTDTAPITPAAPTAPADSTDSAPTAPPVATSTDEVAATTAVAPIPPVTTEAAAAGGVIVEKPETEDSAPEPAKPAEIVETTVATEVVATVEATTTNTAVTTTATTAPQVTDTTVTVAQETEVAPPPAPAPVVSDEEALRKQREKERRKEEKRAAAEGLPKIGEDEIRREIQVGVERFMAAECGILQELADCIWRVISKVEDVSRRAELWESLILVGNGSKIRGFKDALLQTIQSKYIIPPSSATIFSSELPSNMSTPAATGTSTPVPQAGPSSHTGANPLLVAATTSNLPLPAIGHHGHHSSHGQTPTNIKFPRAPEYFPEWKDAGFEEAAFLGAQVAAKVLFIVDQGASGGFMTRVEYNEGGPAAIHSL